MGGEDPDETWYDANSFINNLSKIKEFRGTYPGEAGLKPPAPRTLLCLEGGDVTIVT